MPQRPDDIADLNHELPTAGCPVCNHLMETTFKFLAKFQYQLSSDEPTQRTFADEWGFCPLHTWQLAALASPHGLSLGYPRLLERLSAVLSEVVGQPRPASGCPGGDLVSTLVPTAGSCQVCQLLRQTEQEQVVRLMRLLAENGGRDAYARGYGICLRHLALSLSIASDERGGFLLAEAVRRLNQLAEDMRSYAIKRDAIRLGLLNRDEEHAYLRALVQLAGHKGLCGAWPAEGSF